MEEPLRTIVENAGLEGSVVVNKIKEGKADYGFNARIEKYENLFKAGVIDPTKVSRVALENAASIAGMMLTTECVIADKTERGSACTAMAHRHGRNGRILKHGLTSRLTMYKKPILDFPLVLNKYLFNS